jgi:hypothetical protein
MTLHLGKVKPGSTIYIPFDTFAGSTGASITMTGLATSDILIYKNGGTTQRASTTGFTLLDTDGIDFDAITGIHGLSIDLSSNATADFYNAGAMYWVVVSTITIDSQTVSFVLATFTIGYEGAVLDTTIATLSTQTSFTLTAGPAEDDALNGCEVVIHDIASAVQAGRAIIADYTGSTKTVTLVAGTTFTAAAGDNISVFLSALQPTVQGRALDVSTGGEAGLDWANIGSPTTAQNLSATNIDVDQVVASVSGAVGSVTGSVGGNVTGSIGSVATGGITSGSFASGAITNTAIATDAIGAAELAADAVAEIADAVWDEDATGHQTQGTFGQAIGDPAADSDTIWALVNTNLDAAVSTRLATAGYTTPPTVGAIADQVWDEATSGHTTSGTFGEQVKTDIDAILADTNELQTDWVDGGRLDVLVDDLESRLGTPSNLGGGATIAANLADIEAQTDDIGTAGAGLTALGDTRIANLDAAVSTRATPAQVNTEADTALADAGVTTAVTGRIDVAVSTRLASSSYAAPLDAAGVRTAVGLASANLDTQLETIDNLLDTEVAAIITTLGTPAGASVSADLVDIENKVDDLEGRLTSTRAGYLDNLSAGAVALQASVDSLEAGVIVTTNNDKTGYALSNGGIDAIFDRTDGVETGYTLRQALRIMAAALAGELSGAATTTIQIRNITDTKVRVTATVDSDGNRTALTLDAT